MLIADQSCLVLETAGRERQNPRRIFHRHNQPGNHIQHTGSPPVGRRRNSCGILPSHFRGFFLIPVAFVSAELATGWPPKGHGGIYIRVREALGERWGFVAIWMQWSENVIWFPTVLSFIGATIACIFMPSLAANKLYMLTTILFIYWAGTFANFHGIKTSTWISTPGVMGTMVSTFLIIALGIAWLISDNPLQVDLSRHAMLPDLTNLKGLVFLAGVMVITCGIEVSAVHEGDVSDPGRVFPKAILLSTVISFCLCPV